MHTDMKRLKRVARKGKEVNLSEEVDGQSADEDTREMWRDVY
jgi:hypothetical protein